MRTRSVLGLVVGVLSATGCGSGGGDDGPYGEIYAAGLTRYVGQFDPSNDPVADSNGVKTFRFAVPAPEELATAERGPLCLRGAQFQTQTRAGSSDALVIFLQGGGACWSDLCAAFDAAIPLPAVGILNPDAPENVVADWDVAYVPYCDGSLFAGDVDRVVPDGGDMGYQRGLINLSAALDVAAREFPNPSRVLLTGISGGAFGTILATPLVRFYYPDAELQVFNDSGVGVAKDGDPAFVNQLLEEWDAAKFIPASCESCTADGHITPLIEWTLERDTGLRVSALSYARDVVIAVTFLQVPQADFTATLLRETGRIATNFPERYKRFILDGDKHTVLLNDGTLNAGGLGAVLGTLVDEADGVVARDWFTASIDATAGWENVVDDAVEAPAP